MGKMAHISISDLKTKQIVKGTDPPSSSNYLAIKWGKKWHTWDRRMGRKLHPKKNVRRVIEGT